MKSFILAILALVAIAITIVFLGWLHANHKRNPTCFSLALMMIPVAILMFFADLTAHAYIGSYVVSIGAIMNFTVMFANRGKMPVVTDGDAEYMQDHGPWVRATDKHRLLWLADQKKLKGRSIGDWLMTLGLIALIVQDLIQLVIA